MRQTELHLTDKDRELIESYRTSGLHHAREVNRAHVLAALDRGVPEAQIMAVLGIGRTAIWRTRSAYLEGGVEHALHDSNGPASFDSTAPMPSKDFCSCLLGAAGWGQSLDNRTVGEGRARTGRDRFHQP